MNQKKCIICNKMAKHPKRKSIKNRKYFLCPGCLGDIWNPKAIKYKNIIRNIYQREMKAYWKGVEDGRNSVEVKDEIQT